MKKLCVFCLLCMCYLCACSAVSEIETKEQDSTRHEHIPDNADCQHVQNCIDCGEQLAEWGEHKYSDTPDEQVDSFSIYTCYICGYTKIINQDGLPVVPVE